MNGLMAVIQNLIQNLNMNPLSRIRKISITFAALINLYFLIRITLTIYYNAKFLYKTIDFLACSY